MERATTDRTFVRLAHPLPADEEIHSVLPDTLMEWEEAFERHGLKLEDMFAAEHLEATKRWKRSPGSFGRRRASQR